MVLPSHLLNDFPQFVVIHTVKSFGVVNKAGVDIFSGILLLTCLLRNPYAGQEATVRTGHGTTDWLKLGKEYIKAVYYHPAYLAYMQSASCKMPGWMNHKLELRLQKYLQPQIRR